MKILQVTNKVPYPVKDGGAIACMNLTRGFHLLGHKVSVLAMNTIKHHTGLNDLPEDIRELADFHLVGVPAPISPVSALINLIFSRLPYNAVRFISQKFDRELKKLLLENEYDVIQLEGLYVCPYIPLIRKYSKALIAYRAHNIEHEIWGRTADLANGWIKVYFRNLAARIKRFEKKWIDKYDVLIPITERDAVILGQLGNSKPFHVTQAGIDSASLFPTARNLEHPTLFHIGSLEWAPNQEGLLWFLRECWPELSRKFPDLKFYIAGRNAPQWFQNRLNLNNVVYLGEIEDAYAFMNSKSVMVVPLFSGSGMRVKIVEGMALGKAIVTTTIGTEGIETTSGENILVADTSESFISSVSDLIENRQLFEKIGHNAVNFIHDNFDNLTIAGKLTEFYIRHLR
jgi:polysaccharide biosynthesis protein PslH